MEELFAAVLSLSLTGSLVILAVLLARLVLKRAPKIFSYALWAVVLVRLVCPVSFSSPYYGVTSTSIEPIFQLTENAPVIHAISPGAVPTQPQGQAVPPISPLFVLSLVWAVGVAAMLIYGLFSYVRLRRKLVGAVRLKENIYMADYLETPFVMGFVRPKIYLPSTMEDWEKPYILAHEKHHIRRLDYLAKPLGFLALCLHWFNPLVWMAFLLFCKDMEMSCDEAVIKKLGESARADYSAALLSLATGRKMIAGMPLAFGEGDTKGRIQNMKNWKKPVLWIVVAAAIGCAVLAAFLLTDKKDDSEVSADLEDSSSSAQNEDDFTGQDANTSTSTGNHSANSSVSVSNAVSNAPTNNDEYSDLSFLTDDQQVLYNTACEMKHGIYGMGANLMYLWGYHSVADIDENYVLYDADYDAFSDQIHKVFTDNCLADSDYAKKFINHNGKLALYDFLSDDMVEGTTRQVNEAFPDTYRLVSCTENEVKFMLISHYDRNGWNGIDDPMDVYTIEYPIRMIHTDDGWRIDEFHTTYFG